MAQGIFEVGCRNGTFSRPNIEGLSKFIVAHDTTLDGYRLGVVEVLGNAGKCKPRSIAFSRVGLILNS